MFGDFIFPDEEGTRPTWDSLSALQKDFMQWFNAERLKTMITFPVESFALVYQDGKFLDEDSAQFVADEYARGHSFFTYISDTVDSLSSCCFNGDELIKVTGDDDFYITIEELVSKFTTDNNKDGIDNIDTGLTIDAYSNNGDYMGKTKITGVLRKSYTGQLFTFNVGERQITVTGDHILLVKDIEDNNIKELPASIVAENVSKYLISIE